MAKTITLTARFPEDLAAALEAVSIIEKRPIGAVLREAAELWLEDHVDAEQMLKQLETASAARRVREEEIATLAQRAVKNAKAPRVPVGAGGPAALEEVVEIDEVDAVDEMRASDILKRRR